MIAILQPIYKATELLSGSTYPTLGDMRMVMLSLLAHLQHHSTVNSQAAVAEAIKAKLEAYWPILKEASVLGAMLDPRSKLSGFASDERPNAVATLEEIYEEYNRNGETLTEPNKPMSARALFRRLATQQETPVQNIRATEIERYLMLPDEADDIDCLAWWQLQSNRFPALARIARDYLGTPASSVPCESMFSLAKRTISSTRNRLDGQTARASLCLRSWILDTQFKNLQA